MGFEIECEAVQWWKYLNVRKKIKNKKGGKKKEKRTITSNFTVAWQLRSN
jgi:hypothetical protein